MILSKSGFRLGKVNQLDNTYPGQEMLMQTNQLIQFGSGIYAYDFIPLRIQQKIEEVIRKHFDNIDAVECQMPILQQEKIWQLSGRWEKYIKTNTMFVSKTSDGNYGLAPTAEEAITLFAAKKLLSYKDLPTTFYQIGPKFRDEIRTRGYLFRGKAFQMFDAYSFDINQELSILSYNKAREAYFKIFEELGLQVYSVAADGGDIGGSKSEEFMVISNIGDDSIYVDEAKGIGVNCEVLERADAEVYLLNEFGISDIKSLKKVKAIEVGHIFQLGTKYSSSMQLSYVNNQSNNTPYYMGCYGIGVSRILGLIYEQNVLYEKNMVSGYSIPCSLTPLKLSLIGKSDDVSVFRQAEEIYNKNTNKSSILFDDSDNSIGFKIKTAKTLGIPFIAVIGNHFDGNNITIEETKTGIKKDFPLTKFINNFMDCLNEFTK